jgi:F-type H+-transporting ATPase subunit g
MSLSMTRPLVRTSVFRARPAPGRMLAQRFESTTAQKATEAAKDAASKAGSVASDVQTKAAQGLSRVTSAAGPVIVGAAKGVTGALGRIGGRTGRLIAFVESAYTRSVSSRRRYCDSTWSMADC